VILSVFKINLLFAAPCCSRNSSVPIVIAGDDEAQVNFGHSVGTVVAQVPTSDSPDSSQYVLTSRLEAAFLLSDRFQAGVGLPLVYNRYTSGAGTSSSVGIGDIKFSLAYEVMPVWSYSDWKPQGYLFSMITAPTGRSLYDSVSGSTDITGNGYFAASLGALFLKRWTLWDVFFVPEVHYGLPRHYQEEGAIHVVQPGFGGSLGLGIGYSPRGGNLRIGMRVQPRLDQTSLISGPRALDSDRGWISNCDAAIDLAYMLGSHDTIMVSYLDQTVLGYASNTTLTRSVGINYQHRWER
jgi:hypothetical protein